MTWLVAILGLYLFGTLIFVSLLSFVNLVDRGDPLAFDRDGVARFVREWMAHALVVPLLLAGLGQPGPRERARSEAHEDEPEQVPVLLVPGYGLNRACWLFFATHLHRQGWRWVWAINNQPASSPIPVYARAIGERVEELRRATGAPKVDLVGHSMGGIVAAWYVNRLDGAPQVRRLVTLGTPWRGTRVHVLGQRRQALDLSPTSEVIADVRNPRVPTTAIWSRTDELVSPPSANVPEGATAVELRQVGHLELLWNARAWRAVTAALSAPEPAPLDAPARNPEATT